MKRGRENEENQDTTEVKEEKDEQQHKKGKNTDKQWTDLLDNTRIHDLLEERTRPLIMINKDGTLFDAIHVLKQENLLSLPVVDEEDSRFLGFVDVLDIASFVLVTWKNVSASMDEIHFPTTKLFNTPVVDILNYSQVNLPVFVEEDSSLKELIRVFMDPHNYYRLHRVAVTNATGDFLNVVSQSDIISFVYRNLDHFPAWKKDLKLGSMSGLIRSPVMVRVDSPFYDTLETLCKNKISGLALVDEEFKLCGNISASDLRGLNPLAFDFFSGSTLQFLCRGIDCKLKATQFLGPSNTFGETITLLVEQKIHRLYITGPTGYPIGFVSLIDVIARLT
eukprot:TRINITY_DN7058_c0_g1_i5.p1 TRINITY_DN7058_c0_g1~~TRINITY_DN7058_c0_g1_i5.p1  ORF type:complete len:336 (-),score=57.57 TRINITY_DN7058_c0_g1_i5:192-1199(-)